MTARLLLATAWLIASSTAPALRSAEVLTFAWSGGVTHTEATVVCQTHADSNDVRLALSKDPNLSTPVHESAPHATDAQRIVRFSHIADLSPNTTYYYAISVDGARETVLNGGAQATGSFTTLPIPGTPSTYSVVLGACLRTDQIGNEAVFDTMRAQQPLFWMCTGDFHYSDIPDNDPEAFRAGITSRLIADSASTRLADLSRSAAFVYMWDDHDFGPNNSAGAGKTDSFKQAAHQVYRQYVPHHNLPLAADPAFTAGEEPLAQAFTVGRVRFILTDLRSESTGGGDSGSLLGARQKMWFKRELLAANGRHAAIVWLTSVPWNGIDNAKNGGDRWQFLPSERREIADFLHRHNIQGLLAISGDMHGAAIDDGTNTDFTTGSEGTGFPLFHAAPLSNVGSYKGGPYSEGAYKGGGTYFGQLDVQDDGNVLSVTMTAKDQTGATAIADRDRTGNPLSYDVHWSHPLLIDTIPANSAEDVAPIQALTLTFSEVVRLGSSGTVRIHRREDHQEVASFDASSPELTVAGTTMTVTPASPLPQNTELSVHIDGGTIEDLDGHGFAGLQTVPAYDFHGWTFTTGARDSDPPAAPTGLDAEVVTP